MEAVGTDTQPSHFTPHFKFPKTDGTDFPHSFIQFRQLALLKDELLFLFLHLLLLVLGILLHPI